MNEFNTRISKAMGRWSSPFRRRLLRILAVAVGVMLAVIVAIQLAAPLLISTPIVRGGMERALAEWTGDDVAIYGPQRVSFWPVPRIEVSQVAITKQTDNGLRVLARISRLTAEFSLFQALQGRTAFHDFELVEPEFFVIRNAEGQLDWAEAGLLSAASREAAAGDTSSLSPELDPRVGDVAIENGRLEIEDKASGDIWRVSGITGSLQWPRLSSAASMQVSALVGEQALQFSGSSRQPLLLLSGANAPFEGRLSSNVVSGRFSGTANLADYSLLSGDVEIDVSDPATLLTWAGVTAPNLRQLNQFSLDASLLTTGQTLRFDNLNLSFNEAEANGVMDLALPTDRPPRLTGTLAMEELNLPALVAGIEFAREPHSPLAKELDLDLRISGQDMSVGPLTVTQTALSIMNEGGSARIDIVDGSLEGGRLTSQMIASHNGASTQSEFRLALRDANLQSLFQTLRVAGPVPQARGSIELSLKTGAQGLLGDWRDAQGEARITTGAGVLADLDPATVLRRVGERSYQPLQNPEGQDFDYQRLDVTADLRGGAAEIRTGVIENASTRVTLSGVIPFIDGGLALLANIGSAGTPAEEHILFIGGSAARPVAIAIRKPGPTDAR